MTLSRFILSVGLLALISSGATAFEQTQQGGAPSGATGSSALTPIIEPSTVPGVQITIPEPAGTSTGTEVRLPVLGVIGTLPKLDFGLELLYGADSNAKVEEDLGVPDDTLTIRGTLKHRF